MIVTRLSDQVIKKLPAPKSDRAIYYDADFRGFGVVVFASGARCFVLRYKTKAGRQRRLTIGSFPDWGTYAAREEAKRLKRLVDGGGDPVGDLQEKRSAPTVDELCDRFLKEVLPRRKPSTQHTYKLQVKNVIRPELGRMKIAEVSFADIDRLHRKISQRGKLYRANRILALLSSMMGAAIRWKWRTDNPCAGVERNTEHKRRRYLTLEELSRLGGALPQLRDPQSAAIIGLALLTGARRGEVLAARWEDFDREFTTWTKPASTTKTKVMHVVPLTEPARQLLLTVHGAGRPNSSWVFPAADGSPRKDVREAWARACELASIEGARFHDLRHSYASVLASTGHSLPLIGELLGHSTPVTTARYAHLYSDPLRAAANQAAEIIAGRALAPPKDQS
jgi:integrase